MGFGMYQRECGPGKVPSNLFIYLFIHYFERVSQLANKLFYLAALYKYLYTYIQ